jgi:hypothetical protein
MEENMSRTSERRATRAAPRKSQRGDHGILGNRVVWFMAGGIVLVLLVGIVVLNMMGQASAFSNPAAVGTAVPSLGGQHVQVGAQHVPYNSTPPTSGPHWDTPADWSLYREPVPEERWVHNLEHGGIVILYNCAQGCPDLTGRLDTLFKTAPRSKLGNVKLLITPYDKVPNRLTLVAWNYYLPLDDYDDAVVRGFIINHLDKAPEQVM